VQAQKYQSFEELGIKKDVLLGLSALGFKVPTPVQEDSIPLIMEGRSIIARAKNGTGKSGAFLIPIINQIK
jgi:ATP-dependent RNA helicase DDX6/DHH1